MQILKKLRQGEINRLRNSYFFGIFLKLCRCKLFQMQSKIIFFDSFCRDFLPLLAFRPRRDIPFFRRNLYVAQTQILLAIVAAALMMIVGNNAARAFAIFAAVSLVRFRTNIRDPKEISVLLISLALGLAAGVGRWELGIFLCFFVVVLWILEYNESEQVFRTMELTVQTKNTDVTHERMEKIFEKYEIGAEVRQIDPPNEENNIGCITYYLNLSLDMSTNYLSDRILSYDPTNQKALSGRTRRRNRKSHSNFLSGKYAKNSEYKQNLPPLNFFELCPCQLMYSLKLA